MAQLFYLPFNPVFNSRGLPTGAAQAYFFYTGTTDLAPIYSDGALTTRAANPATADALGQLPKLYLDNNITYRLRVVDARGQQLGDDYDPYVPGKELVGPTGPANNTYSSYTALQASDPTRKYAYLAGDTDTPPRPDGPYTNTTGQVGAWTPQPAGGIATQQAGTGAIVEDARTAINRTVWVEQYGANTANTASQNDAAFAAAINALPASGGTVLIGTSLTVNQIVLPNDPKVVNLVCEKAGEIVMGTAAGPVIRKDTSVVGRITGARHKLRIRANANSLKTNLAHIAVDASGFGRSDFDIQYSGWVSGTAQTGSVGVLVKLQSNSLLTYNNRFRFTIKQCYGPSRVLYCTNDGGGTLSNPNNIEMHDSWFYGIAGCDVIFDGYACTRAAIVNNLFEDCAGATAITLGQNFSITRNWFELMGANMLSNGSLAATDGSGAFIFSNYFSGAGVNQFDTMGVPPVWIGNAGGGQTFTGATTPLVIAAPGSAPAAPTASFTGGSSSLIGAALVVGPDFTGRVTFHLRYAVTPSTANSAVMATIAAPSGYLIEQANAGMTRGANGKPALSAIQADMSGGVFGFYVEGADAHEFDARVSLRKSA